MKKTMKLIALSLTFILVLGALVGCGGKETATTEGELNLRWMLLGPGEQKDSQLVWDAFNEKLADYIPDTTVDFKVYSTAEYAEKYKLVSAANDPLDLVWIGWLVDYPGEAKKGSYVAIDELLDKYGKDIKEELPEALLDSLKVDGKLYQIPNYQMMVGGRWGLAVNAENAAKYTDLEKMQEVFYAHETMTEECYDVIEEYLEALKANGKLNLGVSTETFARFVQKGYQQIAGYDFVIRRGDPECKVLNFYETPEMKLFFEKMNDWYKKGYIRRDMLTVQNPTQEEGKIDGYDMWVTQAFDNQADSLTQQHGYDIDLVPQTPDFFFDGGSATGTAISANTKSADRAMQILDLVNTAKGKDIYNLLVYGIEGEHYNKISDVRIETTAWQGAPESNSAYGQYKWVVGNTFNAYEIQTDLEGWNDYILGINEAAIASPVAGLVFDNTNVKIEQAQIDAVNKEFVRSLNSGAVADYEAHYNKFLEKFEAAGASKYQAEIQRQVDEHLKNN